jgi:hypothetical protein
VSNITNKSRNFFLLFWITVVAFLVGSFLFVFIETTLEEIIGYSLILENTPLYLMVIYFVLLLCLFFGGFVTKKKIVLRHNAKPILELFFFKIPLLVLISLLIIALVFFDVNTKLEDQYYFSVFENFKGKVLIHFIPSVLCWKILNDEISTRRSIFFIIIILIYTAFYSERAFFLYVIVMGLFWLYRNITFSIKLFLRILVLALFSLSLFVLVESTRSGAKLTNNINNYSLAQYGLERLVLYYKDTTIKSANCINGLVEVGSIGCTRSLSEHPSVTNRGGVYMLFSEKGFFGGMIISSLMFFITGIILTQAAKKEQFFVLISPQFIVFCLEFNRLNRLDSNQTYIVVLGFFIFFLLFSKRKMTGLRNG